MELKHSKLALALMVSSFSGMALAIEPAAIPVGALSLTPTLDITEKYQDNFYNAVNNEVGTAITTIRPSFDLQGQKGNFTAGVTYAAEAGFHHSTHDDDYVDHAFSAYADLDLSSRQNLALLAEYLKLHDARNDSGSGDSLSTAQADKPSRYSVKGISATFSHGTTESKGQIVVKGGLRDKEYDNFRAVTAAKDRQTKSLSGTFYYRISPRTRLLAETRFQEINYDLATVTLDSTETKYLVGAEWDATAKTTGSARLGITQKNFDDASRDDFTGGSWEVGVEWSPRTYSVFDLTTSRTAEESSGTGDYIDTINTTLGWTHDWNERFSTRVSQSFTNEEYVNSVSGKEDDTNITSLGLTYDMRRWLTFGVDLSHKSFDSNLAASDYESNEIIFTVQSSL